MKHKKCMRLPAFLMAAVLGMSPQLAANAEYTAYQNFGAENVSEYTNGQPDEAIEDVPPQDEYAEAGETEESTVDLKESREKETSGDENPVLASETYMDSGRSSLAKLSMKELAALYQKIGSYSELYAVKPDISKDSYHISTLTNEALAAAENQINYYRLTAGLDKIELTDVLNESAAYGALVQAMGSQFSHYPAQPEGMADADYQLGYYADSHSNISYSYGYALPTVLGIAIQGQLEDKEKNNISRLGHRRWLLHPATTTMGIGTADNSGNYYTSVRVFGDNVEKTMATDYDFIAWPSSGNNLSDTFAKEVPWSVTLNPEKYKTPSLDSVHVRLTHDGTTWEFQQATGTVCSSDQDYFTVETNGYGIANCIIFRPAPDSIGTYSGEYLVTISGLKDANNNDCSISYKVLFDSVKNVSATEEPSAGPSAGASSTPSAGASSTPSASPSADAGSTPSARPSMEAGSTPSAGASSTPSASPSADAGSTPSASPSAGAGSTPSASPSSTPSINPGTNPDEDIYDWGSFQFAVREKCNLDDMIRMELSNEISGKLKYISTNRKIVSVSSRGILTAKAEGKAEVYVSYTDLKGSTDYIKLDIEVRKPVFKITKDITFWGQQLELEDYITNLPEEAVISWSIPASKQNLAEVEEATGIITGKKNGTVRVTCKIGDGKYAAKYSAVLKIKFPKYKSDLVVKADRTKTVSVLNVSKYTDVQWLSLDSQSAQRIEVIDTGKNTAKKIRTKSAGIAYLWFVIDEEYYSVRITVTQ